MAKANVWTVPHGSSGWANKREGATRVSKVFATKAAAQTAGRKTAMRDKVEHLVHTRDGGIGERNSYGNDPPRSKG
jgi:ketosteroid isomerase-like protein